MLYINLIKNFTFKSCINKNYTHDNKRRFSKGYV